MLEYGLRNRGHNYFGANAVYLAKCYATRCYSIHYTFYVDDLKTFYDTFIKPAQYKEQNPTAFQKSLLLSPMHGINTDGYPDWVTATLVNVNMLFGWGNGYVAGGHPYDPNMTFEKNKGTHSKLRFNFDIYARHIYRRTQSGWQKQPGIGTCAGVFRSG